MPHAAQDPSILHRAIQPTPQTVGFAPLAWLKVLHLMSHHRKPVAFTGVPRADADPLYLEDVELPAQEPQGSSVQILYAGHHHSPGEEDASGFPSRVVIVAGTPSLRTVDAMALGHGWLDWWAAVHVSRNARPTAWLIFNTGPKAMVEVPVRVDWRRLSRDLLDCEGQLDLLVGSWTEACGRIRGAR